MNAQNCYTTRSIPGLEDDLNAKVKHGHYNTHLHRSVETASSCTLTEETHKSLLIGIYNQLYGGMSTIRRKMTLAYLLYFIYHNQNDY